MRGLLRTCILLLALLGTALPGKAFSFDLDSIAAMGRFPAFCVRTYRLGDRIFNSYDTAYVKSPGLPFKISATSDSWLSYYNFHFPDEVSLDFISIPSTTVGIHLSWLAVSIGYDKNVSNLLGLKSEGHQRWTFGFNSQRLVADFYLIHSDGGLKMNEFRADGKKTDPDLYFNGGSTTQWQLLAFYFFNNLRYSHSASFSYGKLQTRTSGSWFVGLAAAGHAYDFDFSSLPEEYLSRMPLAEYGNRYRINTHLWGISGGYAANICLGSRWVMGIMESPVTGVRYGHDSSNRKRARFGLSNTLNLSFIYNHPDRRLYLGCIGTLNSNLITDHIHTLNNLIISMNFTVGYRF